MGELTTKILIIYSHPSHESLSGAVLSALTEALSAKNEVKLIDLYQEKFDPVLFFDKEHRRRDLQFDESTKNYRDLIAWSEHLIFIFPIWWGGMPAILKGFIDRVFVKEFAYRYKGLRPEGLLKGRTAAIITTHDTPQLFVRLVQQDYGKVLQRQVLGLMTGIKTTKFLQLSYIRGSSEAKRTRFLDKVAKYAQTL